MNNLLQRIINNLTEIYLGILLFVAVPVLVSFYFDWRAGLLTSAVFQIAFLILYIRSIR